MLALLTIMNIMARYAITPNIIIPHITRPMQNSNDFLQIIFTIEDSKIQYQVPCSWSINKTKCLIACEYPRLRFNEFELMHGGKLLKGSFKVGDVCVGEAKASFVVVRTKSEITF